MEVSCRATRILLEACEAVGIDPRRVAEATDISIDVLRDTTERLDWNSFAALTDRICELCDHDPDRIRLVGEAIVHAPASDFLQRLGRCLVSPRQIHHAGAKWVAPSLFPTVSLVAEDVGDDRIRLTGELPPGHANGEAFFRICVGSIAAQTRVLGLPDARVEAQITPTRVVYFIELPRSRSILDRGRRAVRAALNAGKITALLDEQRRELDRSFAAALRASDDYRALLDGLPDMVLIHRDGKVLYVNRALVTTLGYDSPQELVGRSNLDVVHPSMRDEVRALMSRPPRSDGLPLGQFRLLRKDGGEIIAETAPAQEVSFGGRPARLVASRDVTERVRMQRQLVLADRMASLGVLAAGVAHEINNPLAYALGNIEVASARIAAHAPEAARAALATAADGLERVRTIVKDLKAISRGDEEHIGAVDVRTALETTLTLASKSVSRRARLVRQYGATPAAWGNAARLGQVFLNLIANAVEAIPEGRADEHEIRLRTFTDGDGRVVVEIADTGEGIADEALPYIFDPFFTTKPVGTGTGLGLAVCHGIVTSLGGTITVRSSRGVGTTFRVTLPAAPIADARVGSDSAPPPSSRKRARVLVIDDEPHFANLLKQILDAHDVSIAPNAKAALPILAERAFDVIVCDLMMPELSGPELHAELARTRPELCDRMIFMTGGAFTEHARAFLAKTPNACLEKPFDARELVEAVEARLGSRPEMLDGSLT